MSIGRGFIILGVCVVCFIAELLLYWARAQTAIPPTPTQKLLIFPKYMTTDCTLMRYISIGLIGDDWHGEEAVGRSNKETAARRTPVAGREVARRRGVGR